MMKVIVIGYPNRAEERAILDAMATTEPMPVPRAARGHRRTNRRRRATSSTAIYVDDKIRDYIVDIVLATRPTRPPYGFDL